MSWFHARSTLSSSRLLAIFLAITGSLYAATSSANLINNGDFEADTVSGPAVGLGYEYVTTGSLSGWTVTDVAGPIRGAVLFNSTYGQPLGGGSNSLQIEDNGDSISQTISTSIGTLYELSFDLSAYSGPGNASVQVGIGVDNFLFSGNAASYVTQTTQFVATSTNTLIRFTSLLHNAGDRYPHLDNVSVTEVSAVPIPFTWSLMLTGLLGIRWIKGRK